MRMNWNMGGRSSFLTRVPQ